MQSLFDFLPNEQAQRYKQLPSTEWRWTMKDDYPKEKNGLKVFSCFACGGGQQWAINLQDAMF